MVQVLLLLTGALVVGAIVFGVAVLITGGDALDEIEPDGRSVPLPVARPLAEADMTEVRFDTVFRGYRMAQVDQALRRAAYDIGYKGELIQVLEAEIEALRAGRVADADALRQARLAAAGGAAEASADPTRDQAGSGDATAAAEAPSGAITPPADADPDANASDATAPDATAPDATAPDATAPEAVDEDKEAVGEDKDDAGRDADPEAPTVAVDLRKVAGPR